MAGRRAVGWTRSVRVSVGARAGAEDVQGDVDSTVHGAVSSHLLGHLLGPLTVNLPQNPRVLQRMCAVVVISHPTVSQSRLEDVETEKALSLPNARIRTRPARGVLYSYHAPLAEFLDWIMSGGARCLPGEDVSDQLEAQFDGAPFSLGTGLTRAAGEDGRVMATLAGELKKRGTPDPHYPPRVPVASAASTGLLFIPAHRPSTLH